jgi:hypothetical protein
MGIKKLPWKKIWGYLWKIILGIIVLIGLISALIGITKDWNIVLNGLSSIGNFFLKILSPLANPIVRDVLLFLLIMGTLFWVFRINIKLKKLSQTYEEKLRVHLEEKPKKEEKPEKKEESEKIKEEIKPKKEKKKLVLTEEQLYILVRIVESHEMLSFSFLYKVYEEKYPPAFLTNFKSIIILLEKNKLIWHSGYTWNDFSYRETDKGVEYVSEVLKKSKK